MPSWSITPKMTDEQRDQVIEEVASAFKGRPLAELRQNSEKLLQEALPMVRSVIQRMGLQAEAEIEEIAREVVARIGGLGFLEPLLRLESGYTEIAVNTNGTVWVVPKGEQDFVCLEKVRPSLNDAWRAVEALLAPLGRACNEATPSVDAKLPRQEGLPGGARVKILHPIIAPGLGFPAVNIRLFEPRPVPPEQLAAWNVAPKEVIDALVEAVRRGLRILVLGGTATGKTTLLSAICSGIPKTARVVKIEDPEEIWLDHAHVVTLEARPAQIGTSVAPYTLASGVDDAMRMSPRWLIVGEMRRGDAVAALFRAQMSDHPGLSTFHAESPEAAISRLSLLLFNDVQIRTEGAKEMFAQAVDMVVQVGFRQHEGKRRRHIVGIWSVQKTLKAGNVVFSPLYRMPGEEIGERSTAMIDIERMFNEFSRQESKAGEELP